MTPELRGYVEGLRSRNEPGLKRIADEIETTGIKLMKANQKLARIKHVLISPSRSNRELLIYQILGA